MTFGRIVTHTTKGAPLRFSQGAIVSGVRLPEYGPHRYSAFVLTARCDLANSKTELVHCLHVVPVDEWLRFTALVSMIRSRIETLEGKFSEAISKKAPELLPTLKTYKWTELVENILSQSEKLKDRLQSLRELVMAREQLKKSYERITDAQTSANELATQPEVKKVFEEGARRMMERLLAHELADAHYLPSHVSETTGSVVLFRHIVSFPRLITPFLEEGLLTTNVGPEAIARVRELFLLDDNDPPGITASVVPPHIEHILQRFSHLYSRIGVEDFPEDYLQTVVNNTCKLTP